MRQTEEIDDPTWKDIRVRKAQRDHEACEQARAKDRAEIERLKTTIEAKDAAIKIVQRERDEREQYWRDWNGRAANRAALLEGEIDRLVANSP